VAISFVQKAEMSDGATSNSWNLSLGTTTVGNLILALVNWQGSSPAHITSLSDSQGESSAGGQWRKFGSTLYTTNVSGGGVVAGELWYKVVGVGGSTVLTFNSSNSGTFHRAASTELSGANSPWVDSNASNPNTVTSNGTSIASGSLITNGSNDALVELVYWNGANSLPSSGSFTQRVSGGNGSAILDDLGSHVAGTYNYSGTAGSNQDWGSFLVALTAAATTIPTMNSWVPTEGQEKIALNYAASPDWNSPSKFGLIVAVPPTLSNWSPTVGQQAIVLPHAPADYASPAKFGLLTVVIPSVAAWTPTDGKKAVTLNYNRGEFSAPPKFGLTAVVSTIGFVNLSGKLQFTISPNAYTILKGTLVQPARNFVQLAGTLLSKNNFGFIRLAGLLQISSRNYMKLAGTLLLGSRGYVKLAGTLTNRNVTPSSFINLAGTLVQKLTPGVCGNFPDRSFINLAGWLVNPASTNDSRQMPGQGFTITDDWSSSNDAFNSYKPNSRFTIFGNGLPSSGISIIVSAFTAGVVSFQTRTRTWLRRVDQAPNGILLNSKVNKHTLPNGSVITTTTQTIQNQDTLTTTTTIQNSGTPTRTSVIVTEKNGNGQIVTRETETDTVNGIINSLEKKTIKTQPPTQDNVQPLQVRTLDGVIHYQFFGTVNPEWSGGDQEGLTTTSRQTQIVPGTLNGKTTDPFGNLIYNQMTDETETDPTGKVIQTHTEQIGTRKDIGTTTSDTTQQFNGLLTTVIKTVTLPDGSQKVTNTTTNPVSGDSTQTTTETVTDEFGQVTTTVTLEETKIFPDPVTGANRQTTTKTVNVTKGGVTTTDNSVDTTTDYEDDIIRNKVKVYFIQEFTITCTIDEFSMMALSEINITHQKNYALLELFGQQLGNANLSYALRQQLINQFNQANGCIAPVTLQALGRNFRVVFAQSASSFRAKYIPGAEPHVYELQMILQERSDLMNGAFGGG
jgi:hypothetical protein